MGAPRAEQVLYPAPVRFVSPGEVCGCGYSAGQTHLFAPVVQKPCRPYDDSVMVSWLQCTEEACIKKSFEGVLQKIIL